MLMQRAAIAQAIPHGNGMCMLDELLAWDDEKIQCTSFAHRRPDNPLLEDGRLHCACLVEFCAQAAALHSVLVKRGASVAGLAYLGAVKQLELPRRYVDLGAAALQIEASCIVNNESGAIYQIAAQDQRSLLLRGRIVLVQVS
jgi:predicted hotdog family 3-hydroxylacyl-ACP dehydratase